MSERDLDARLDAVERALTDDDADLSDLRETTAALDDLDGLESRVTEIESRLDELEAGLEAVRGYAGNVRAVNRDVERRASAALAKAETLENAVEDRPDSAERGPNATERVEPDRGIEQVGPAPEAEHRTRDQFPSTQPARRDAGGGAAGSTGADPRPADSAGVEPQRRGGTEQRGASTRAAGDGSDAPRSTGRRSGDEDGEPSRRRARRSSDDRADAGANESRDGESQTEQFIERVRDAL